MKQLRIYTIIGIVFVLITGSLAHFLYDWTNQNFFIGLFTPVNESIWEHMKLLFFPMLLYAVFMNWKLKDSNPCISSALCSGLLSGTVLIPVLFYGYTAILGQDSLIADIAIFILSTIVSFVIVYRLALSCKAKPYELLLYCLTVLFVVCFFLFTYHPPDFPLFIPPEINNA